MKDNIKRRFNDPVMISNVLFLFPLSMWWYIGFYGYTLQFMLLLMSSYLYHRSYEERYFWLDVFFGSSSIMYAIIDNLTMNDINTWIAVASTLIYYMTMCGACQKGTRCYRYRYIHTGWHFWVSASSCVWAYASGKCIDVF